MNRIRIGVMGLVLVVGFAARVSGGLLSPTAGTNSLTSAMFTLEDIYQYISAGNTGAVLKAFTEPTAGPASTMHTLTDIMGVVTNRAPLARTGWTNSYQPNDDGYYHKGVASPNPRFTNNGDGTATDNLTGLMWTTNANIYGVQTNWQTAVTNASICTVGGYADWRMPNINEQLSLFVYTINVNPVPLPNPFGNFANGRYWTSTPSSANTAAAFYINMNNSVAGTMNAVKTTSGYFVWPVRGGR